MECLATKTKLSKDGFLLMFIHGVTYTEKEKASGALLESCKHIQSTELTKIGIYRGFDMYLLLEHLTKSLTITLKGKMNYSAALGKDTFGNITRINNAFEDIPTRLQS